MSGNRGTNQLSLAMTEDREVLLRALGSTPRAIEDPSFPFEHLSEIAEAESWRKEIYRPIYHIHKWWAQRLGSVFRAIVLGSFAPSGSDVVSLFYQSVRVPDAVVFDPFMGSGTTLGEALKLGAHAIGRDINPVSHRIVSTALAMPARESILSEFRKIEIDVASEIQRFYQARLAGNRRADVLYYFWVKEVACPRCQRAVPLFSSYIFSHHAYPKRSPEARCTCPRCRSVLTVSFNDQRETCAGCGKTFDPHAGPVHGAKATCPGCAHPFSIVGAARESSTPPPHSLYAKLIMSPDGEKHYVEIDDFDRELYAQASSELARRRNAFPVVPIQPGFNTKQVLNYSYTFWHQMFNDRQLLCLSILADRIREISDESLRHLFMCLFSGTLEFNNMFASFKGEGTGAVRHMFSHHVLKPERIPLEANLWGTPKSSGSFSTLFERRILRALDYAEDPFEIRVQRRSGKLASSKVFGLSERLSQPYYSSGAGASASRFSLSLGDSSTTDLPSESVDAVITDPPFFDNVHYSELADFFFVWQQHIRGSDEVGTNTSTRSDSEVQHTNARSFTDRLRAVWTECHRILKADGLLVFTYHHSRPEGWRCLLDSLAAADFVAVAAHPIKAEMSVAQPKHQASNPIDLDTILVCRKWRSRSTPRERGLDSTVAARERAQNQIARFANVKRALGPGDISVIFMAQLICAISQSGAGRDATTEFDRLRVEADEIRRSLVAEFASGPTSR